jgi:hypothetical protein
MSLEGSIIDPEFSRQFSAVDAGLNEGGIDAVPVRMRADRAKATRAGAQGGRQRAGLSAHICMSIKPVTTPQNYFEKSLCDM